MSIDALADAIRGALERIREVVTQTSAAQGTAEELRDQFASLGAEDKAGQAAEIAGNLEGQQGQAAVIAQQAEAALALAEAMRTGSGSGGSGTPPVPPPVPAVPPPEPTGWDSAPDLATSRDAMPRLGEVTPGRESHILNGDWDGIGGGHRWDSANPGKSKFPRSWDDDKIIDAISDVGRSPDEPPSVQLNGCWRCHGTRDAVVIRVVLEPDGSVRTGHPLSGPGVETNPD